MLKFNNKSRPRSKEDKENKEILMKVYMLFMRVKNQLLILLKWNISNKKNICKCIKNINYQKNASTITNSSCTSKNR